MIKPRKGSDGNLFKMQFKNDCSCCMQFTFYVYLPNYPECNDGTEPSPFFNDEKLHKWVQQDLLLCLIFPRKRFENVFGLLLSATVHWIHITRYGSVILTHKKMFKSYKNVS